MADVGLKDVSRDAGHIHSPLLEARANSRVAKISKYTETESIVAYWSHKLDGHSKHRELLEVFRDAIAGHKSLLEDGNVLHWDVSKNNIIITESATDRDPKGRLIDLDLAKELDNVPSGASHRTGTAIHGNRGTPRQGPYLSARPVVFFSYVFIWVCIRYGHDNVGGREEAAASRSRLNIRGPTTLKIIPSQKSWSSIAIAIGRF